MKYLLFLLPITQIIQIAIHKSQQGENIFYNIESIPNDARKLLNIEDEERLNDEAFNSALAEAMKFYCNN